MLKCALCRKTPNDISVYVQFGKYQGLTADQYVKREEGTLDSKSGFFLCDGCYIKAGMPSSPIGWKATPENLALLGINIQP